MKVNKSIKGEVYPFHVRLIMNKMKANVKYLMGDKWVECTLSENFKYVLLPKDAFRFYFDGCHCTIDKLKLNKRQQLDAMDYNQL